MDKSLFAGMNDVNYLWTDAATIASRMWAIQNAGCKWIRVTFYWENIETFKSVQRGFTAPERFQAYAKSLSSTAGGSIALHLVRHNEGNTTVSDHQEGKEL